MKPSKKQENNNGTKVRKENPGQHQVASQKIKRARNDAARHSGKKIQEMHRSELPLQKRQKDAPISCHINQGTKEDKNSLRSCRNGTGSTDVGQKLQDRQEASGGNIQSGRRTGTNAFRSRPGRKPKKETPGIGCAADLIGVVRHLVPNFNQYLAEIHDTRKQERITFELLGEIWSMIMQRLNVTDKCRFWDDIKRTGNLLRSINTISECDFAYLPHSDTLKYIAERLNPADFNEVLCKCFTTLRTAKRLAPFKFGGDILIAIDGTEFNKSRFPIAHSCHRKLNNGKMEYFQVALVAAIVSPSGIRIPLMVEFSENNEGAEKYDKQDCEYKAFFRLAVKLKKRFPLQNFCLLLDGLYFKSGIVNLIEKYHWRYIMTWKFKSVKKFTEIAKKQIGRQWGNRLDINDKKRLEHYTCSWTNNIKYTPVGAKYGYMVNVVLAEGVFEWSKGVSCVYSYVTNIKIKKKDVKEIIDTARERWQIETNFNVQKNSELALESTFGACQNAALVYFMIVQLASFIRTLMISTNYFNKLILIENTGSTMGVLGTVFTDCYRTVKAFMVHFRDALFYKILTLEKLPKGIHIVFKSG